MRGGDCAIETRVDAALPAQPSALAEAHLADERSLAGARPYGEIAAVCEAER